MKVSAEAGQEHGPITLQHAPRHCQEPRQEGSGARPPLRPVPWTSGPEETRPQNLRLHSREESKVGNGPFRSREEQLPTASLGQLSDGHGTGLWGSPGVQGPRRRQGAASSMSHCTTRSRHLGPVCPDSAGLKLSPVRETGGNPPICAKPQSRVLFSRLTGHAVSHGSVLPTKTTFCTAIPGQAHGTPVRSTRAHPSGACRPVYTPGEAAEITVFTLHLFLKKQSFVGDL